MEFNINNYQLVAQREDNRLSKMYIPNNLVSQISPGEYMKAFIQFMRLQGVLDEYSRLYHVPIDIMLTGYDDSKNFRFNTINPVKNTNIIFCMIDEMIDVITDKGK